MPVCITFLIFRTIDGWSVCIKFMFGWICWGFLPQGGVILKTVNPLIAEGGSREELRGMYAFCVMD